MQEDNSNSKEFSSQINTSYLHLCLFEGCMHEHDTSQQLLESPRHQPFRRLQCMSMTLTTRITKLHLGHLHDPQPPLASLHPYHALAQPFPHCFIARFQDVNATIAKLHLCHSLICQSLQGLAGESIWRLVVPASHSHPTNSAYFRQKGVQVVEVVTN